MKDKKVKIRDKSKPVVAPDGFRAGDTNKRDRLASIFNHGQNANT